MLPARCHLHRVHEKARGDTGVGTGSPARRKTITMLSANGAVMGTQHQIGAGINIETDAVSLL